MLPRKPNPIAFGALILIKLNFRVYPDLFLVRIKSLFQVYTEKMLKTFGFTLIFQYYPELRRVNNMLGGLAQN